MRLRLLSDFHPEIKRSVVYHNSLTLRGRFYSQWIHKFYFIIILDRRNINFVNLLRQPCQLFDYLPNNEFNVCFHLVALVLYLSLKVFFQLCDVHNQIVLLLRPLSFFWDYFFCDGLWVPRETLCSQDFAPNVFEVIKSIKLQFMNL